MPDGKGIVLPVSNTRQQYGALKAECQKMAPVIGSGKFITTPIVTVDGRPVQDLSTNDNSQDDNRATSTPSPLDSPLDGGGHVDDAVPDKKVIQWKLMLHQIGLDVVRTDRTLVFYESEANQAKLWDVLAVYAWMDNDIGYCQGMNDICSPMVILIENEADAFWCFERAMRRLVWGFVPTSVEGVLGGCLTVYQLQLIEDLDGGEYLFAFRMLMVLFRREFSFVDALYLWELMWAMEYNPNIFSSYEESSPSADKSSTLNTNGKMLKKCGKFERKNVKTGYKNQHSSLAVFLVASVLATKNKRFLKEAKGLDDVVKILGDITGNLDAKKACNEALKLHKKFKSSHIMSTKMKGLLKGLRYISQIFDNEKEQEMEIGYPTDVKHVAHIGWDGGPSVNTPSWMNEFKPTSEAENHEPNPEGLMLLLFAPIYLYRLVFLEKLHAYRTCPGHRDANHPQALPPPSPPSSQTYRGDRGDIILALQLVPYQGKQPVKPNPGSPEREAKAVSRPPVNPTDIPRKNRQKKSKDSSKDGGGSSRSRARARSQTSNTYAPSPFSDPGCGTESRFLSNETSAGLEEVGEEGKKLQEEEEEEEEARMLEVKEGLFGCHGRSFG
uniref:TBC1 domain family member 15 n=1 Tax=Vitis vinifera TaxID=29760 RepID=A5C2Z7_VITVI|nr:hypothetical protein VITISV_014758 [Vitis vinifera]